MYMYIYTYVHTHVFMSSIGFIFSELSVDNLTYFNQTSDILLHVHVIYTCTCACTYTHLHVHVLTSSIGFIFCVLSVGGGGPGLTGTEGEADTC